MSTCALGSAAGLQQLQAVRDRGETSTRFPLGQEPFVGNFEWHGLDSGVFGISAWLHEAVPQQPGQRVLDCKVDLHIKAVLQILLAEFV